jgi:hypothetical protein
VLGPLAALRTLLIAVSLAPSAPIIRGIRGGGVVFLEPAVAIGVVLVLLVDSQGAGEESGDSGRLNIVYFILYIVYLILYIVYFILYTEREMSGIYIYLVIQ